MSKRGLNNEKTSNSIYLAMSNGQFVKRVKEETETSFSRVLTKGVNKGTTIHEERFSDFTGQLINIDVERSEQFGASWAFVFDVATGEEEEYIVLKLPYSSGYANNILYRLPGVKSFDNDINLRGYNFKPQDSVKDRIGISLNEWQGETLKKIVPFYTREEPNGLPEMKVIKVKGVDTYDDSDRLEFLEALVNNQIKPKLKNGTPKAETFTPEELDAKFAGEDAPF